jgi:ubiquinone/menaquinone biosynthesis C-methylase UbiE
MPASEPARDPKRLAQSVFVKPDNLLDVIDIAWRYSTAAPKAVRTLLDAVGPPRPDARICELGFGTGWFIDAMAEAFPDARLYGLDISPGMVSHVCGRLGDRVALTAGDMEALPFRDASFDVVVTCWTLYFMRDIDAALQGIRRTLRPGGRLVVAVSAPDHMKEYDDVHATALRNALARDPEPEIGARFDLESGSDHMRRHFDQVTAHEWRGWLVLPDAKPLIRLWDSWRPLAMAGKEGDLVRAEFVRLAEEWARREGQIRIRHHDAALVGIADKRRE